MATCCRFLSCTALWALIIACFSFSVINDFLGTGVEVAWAGFTTGVVFIDGDFSTRCLMYFGMSSTLDLLESGVAGLIAGLSIFDANDVEKLTEFFLSALRSPNVFRSDESDSVGFILFLWLLSA